MLRVASLFYSVVRRLQVIDVTQLMHLAADDSDKVGVAESMSSSGYSIRTVQEDELTLLLEENRVDKAVGDPNSLRDPRRVLVAAFYGEQVVSFLWIADEAVDSRDNYSRSEHLGTSIGMPDGTVFLYNAWTMPEHRGKRLIAALLRWTTQHRVCGARSCLTMIDWTNQSSIRAFEYLGMKRLGWVIRLGRGKLQFSIVPSKAKAFGLQVAQEAPGIKLAW
jgi:predicted GNAT family acetyltransferase